MTKDCDKRFDALNEGAQIFKNLGLLSINPVYWTFLASFFSYTKSLMFSYKPQIDDGLDDNAINSGMGPSSNPQISHQLSCSSIRTDGSDFIYQQKLTDPTSSEVRIGDVKLSFYESSLSPDSIQSINS